MTHEVAHHAWTIVSDISEIEPLVASAVNMCASASVSQRACRFNIPIALTEALSNAIVRGNQSDRSRHVTVALAVDEQRVVFEITDEGGGFNPSDVTFSPADADWLEREDGRGLFLMRSLMDSVELSGSSANIRGHTVRLILNRS